MDFFYIFLFYFVSRFVVQIDGQYLTIFILTVTNKQIKQLFANDHWEKMIER